MHAVDLGPGRATLLGALPGVRALERGHPVGAHGISVDGERGPFSGLEGRLQLGSQLADLRGAHAARVDRQRAARVGLARLDRCAQRQVHHRLAVEPGREGVADTADRVLELRPLVLDLVDLARQLGGHRVELAAQGGELVSALHGHGLAEVAVGQAPRGLEELLDLVLQGTHHDDRGQQREDEERGQDRPDHQAPVVDGAAQAGPLLEDADLDGRSQRVGKRREAAAVLATGDCHVAGPRDEQAPLLERRGQQPASPGDPDPQCGGLRHLARVLARARG